MLADGAQAKKEAFVRGMIRLLRPSRGETLRTLLSSYYLHHYLFHFLESRTSMRNRLAPFDLALGLRLSLGGATFERLARELGVSPSQIHASTKRLRYAGLVRPDAMTLNHSLFRDFLIFGARYAFPARPGPVTKGIPTAHSAPPLQAHIDSVEQYVWSSPKGHVVGESIEPLYPRATELRERSPETYRLLTLFDAIRVGRVRERHIAKAMLEEALGAAPRHAT